ncbi:hypothetical protein LJC42_04260 [Eubacteriales bacterium OttesenSCG-928-K08]|nr:hypothetical protein [Eubacteriales bacterium OttesenSCG-928-K08]
MRQCVLDDTKTCTQCMECDRCDLNPDKICDNCCACLEDDAQERKIQIADIVLKDEDEYLKEFFGEETVED